MRGMPRSGHADVDWPMQAAARSAGTDASGCAVPSALLERLAVPTVRERPARVDRGLAVAQMDR